MFLNKNVKSKALGSLINRVSCLLVKAIFINHTNQIKGRAVHQNYGTSNNILSVSFKNNKKTVSGSNIN